MKNSGVIKPPKTFHQICCAWDILKVSNGVIDVVGCFLPEDETHVAGPNAQRFTQRLTEHPSSAHSFAQSSISSSKGQKQTKRLQSVLQKDLSPDLTINKVAVLAKSQTSSSSSTKKITLVGKYKKKKRFHHVGRTMSEKLSMSKSSKDLLDKFAKGFCFSMVHVGINKCKYLLIQLSLKIIKKQ